MPQDYDSFPQGMMQDWEAAKGLLVHRLYNLNVDKFGCVGDWLIPELFEKATLMPLQRKRELAAMMSIAATIQPHVVMEIGADKGGTLAHWIVTQPRVDKVIACEFRGTPYRYVFEKAFPTVKFLWLEESSYTPEAQVKVRDFLGGEEIDCLFIDGDKGAFDKDFSKYAPMVKSGGFVFMHDIYDRSGRSPCAAAFRKIAEKYVTSQVVDLSESVAAKRAAAAGEPTTGCHEDWLRTAGDDCGFGLIHIP